MTAIVFHERSITTTPAASRIAVSSANPVRVMVVVAEHGHDRHVEPRARARDDLDLAGLAVGGQIAREQDDVRRVGDVREGFVDAGRDALVGVQIAGRCDPDTGHRSALHED